MKASNLHRFWWLPGGRGSSVSKRSCIYFPHMASYCSRTVHHIWMWCNHRLLGKICIAWLVGSGFWRLQRRCCTKSFTVIAGVFHVSCKYYASSSPVIMKLEKVQQNYKWPTKKVVCCLQLWGTAFTLKAEFHKDFFINWLRNAHFSLVKGCSQGITDWSVGLCGWDQYDRNQIAWMW